MNKAELIDQIADKSGLSKTDAQSALEAATETITETLQRGSEVQVAGFGKFSVSERSAREGRNPSTGETIQIAASKGAKFSAAKQLKDALN